MENLGAVALNGADGRPDRQAVAECILRNRGLVRSRVRRALGRRGSPADADDALSSVLRRIDELCLRGLLRVGSEAEFWALVLVVTDNVALTRARFLGRAQECAGESGLAGLAAVAAPCADDTEAAILAHRMLMSLPHRKEREEMALKLRGASYAAIAHGTGLTESAARQRWSRICRQLKERFLADV